MKLAIIISYFTLTFSLIVLASTGVANAQQTDEKTRRCFFEVNEIMIRVGIKQLYKGDQNRVNELCKQGDVDRATKFVAWIGAFKRCRRDLDAYIINNKLDVEKKVLNSASIECRRGNNQRAIEIVSEAPKKVPATPAEIISFTANTNKVKKGSSVTLTWHTANANTVVLGRYGINDFQNVQASGSQLVSPDKTTTYVLMAGQSTKKGATAMQSRKFEVTVITPPVGACSIEGKLNGKWRLPIQERPGGPSTIWTVEVGIYTTDSNRPFKMATVSNRGIYRVNNLRAGKQYTIRPFWASSPQQRNISCTIGKAHKGHNFTITRGPLID